MSARYKIVQHGPELFSAHRRSLFGWRDVRSSGEDADPYCRPFGVFGSRWFLTYADAREAIRKNVKRPRFPLKIWEGRVDA
jgi:hypothetical protein